MIGMLIPDLETGSYQSRDTRQPQTTSQNEPNVLPASTEPQNRQIDPNVAYTIIKEEVAETGFKRIDVRLNKEVSEDTLRNIALKLKAQDSQSYPLTFICYYLTGMKVDAWPWATSHFNPDLNVKILELTATQKKAMEEKKTNSNTGSREIEAWVMAEFYVKACLKSPSTADFGSIWGGDYQNPKTHVSYLGNKEYLVRGWVDSQNAFGATVRTDFSLKLKDEGDYSWTLLEGPTMKQR
jgi:hypothetical protein